MCMQARSLFKDDSGSRKAPESFSRNAERIVSAMEEAIFHAEHNAFQTSYLPMLIDGRTHEGCAFSMQPITEFPKP